MKKLVSLLAIFGLFCAQAQSASIITRGAYSAYAYGFMAKKKVSGYTGPGDVVSGATAWYGLRAYNAAYATGSNPAAIIRRASDNTTSTINILSSGAFDTATATTFCASTTCFLSTWYDQSGNGHNATQSTNAKQPQLIFSYLGALPCVKFTAASTTYLLATIPALSQPTSYSAVWSQATSHTGEILSTNTGGVSTAQLFGLVSKYLVVYAGSDVFNGPLLLNTNYASSALANSASSVVDVNGSIASGNAGSGTVLTSIGIGADPAGTAPLNGDVCETGLWPSDTSASFATMTSNQRTYWGF